MQYIIILKNCFYFYFKPLKIQLKRNHVPITYTYLKYLTEYNSITI